MGRVSVREVEVMPGVGQFFRQKLAKEDHVSLEGNLVPSRRESPADGEDVIGRPGRQLGEERQRRN